MRWKETKTIFEEISITFLETKINFEETSTKSWEITIYWLETVMMLQEI